jgi:hypothetical protein
MSGMAEVLAHHQYTGVTVTDQVRVTCLCGWAEEADDDGMHADHMEEVLIAAGFGDVREAKAQALEDAADELARLPYVSPFGEGRAEYERVLAVRRGDADKWLRARAAAVRGEG